MPFVEQIWHRVVVSCLCDKQSPPPNRESPKLRISSPIETWASPGDYLQQTTQDHGDPSSARIVVDESDDPTSPTAAPPVCQIMSDLHLEWRGYEQFEITREAPTLLLVGDTGRFCDTDRFLAFLRRQCELFDRVLLVPGNHEFYGSSREEGLDLAAKFALELGGKFTFMHRRKVELNNGDVVVLGCMLHSHIPDDYTALSNDFVRIRDWTVKDHNKEHEMDLAWLQDSLAEVENSTPRSRVIVATHYAPMFEKTVHPRQENNLLRHCFCSDALDKLQVCGCMDQVSHWVFGHTHYNIPFKFEGVTVLSNQPPGPFSNEFSGRPFNPKLVI